MAAMARRMIRKILLALKDQIWILGYHSDHLNFFISHNFETIWSDTLMHTSMYIYFCSYLTDNYIQVLNDSWNTNDLTGPHWNILLSNDFHPFTFEIFPFRSIKQHVKRAILSFAWHLVTYAFDSKAERCKVFRKCKPNYANTSRNATA